uniref:Uncharacterized protein n=1 Tax=Megaselia scalaris TaxID=36166 RepID=T1H434_MEGSC
MISSRKQQRHNDLGSNIPMGHHNVEILCSIVISEPSEAVTIEIPIVQNKTSAISSANLASSTEWN